ncbi:MAG: protoglobin domain-containing protein [Actinomycetota bacterium]|nr:protoglobin domain-containing protein [Actinomycetota bacterium]
MSTTSIPGYTYGSADVPRSPLSLEELELLKQTVLFGDDDVRYLRMSRDVLADQVEDVLDVWYGFVASHPHLLHFFTNRDTGEPEGDYLDRVRKRFGRWILDTASANYDQEWLDYQWEIARRHHRTAKNRTDGVDSVDNISLRYVITLAYPITATLRPFLEKGGHSAEEVEKMHDAWRKSVLLQITLWAQPYVRDGDY